MLPRSVLLGVIFFPCYAFNQLDFFFLNFTTRMAATARSTAPIPAPSSRGVMLPSSGAVVVSVVTVGTVVSSEEDGYPTLIIKEVPSPL